MVESNARKPEIVSSCRCCCCERERNVLALAIFPYVRSNILLGCCLNESHDIVSNRELCVREKRVETVTTLYLTDPSILFPRGAYFTFTATVFTVSPLETSFAKFLISVRDAGNVYFNPKSK